MWRERLELLRSREGRAAALAALRAWAKAHPKKAGVAAVAGLLALGWIYDHAVGRGVQVIDGSTGRPLEGVYAIWHWGGSPPISWSTSSVCYRIRVARTDTDGRYRMPYWSWTISSLIAVQTGSGPIYYYPGYYKAPPTTADDRSKVELWPDTRSVQDRLYAIDQDQTSAQCRSFEDKQQRRALEPVYKAMVDEAIAIGGETAGVAGYKNILHLYDILRYGSWQEVDRVREQAKLEEKRKGKQ